MYVNRNAYLWKQNSDLHNLSSLASVYVSIVELLCFRYTTVSLMHCKLICKTIRRQFIFGRMLES